MLGDERERGMYDGYGAVMRRCLELPEADVEDWIYGFTHAIWESGMRTRNTRGTAGPRWIASSGPWARPGANRARPSKNAWEGNRGMEVVKWIFVVAALVGMALGLVELATEKPDAATDSDRLPDGLAGTWERRTPDGRMEATIADGAIEVVRVSGDSREVCWRGVYEAKGRKWVVREAPKESHTWVDDTTQIILSMPCIP